MKFCVTAGNHLVRLPFFLIHYVTVLYGYQIASHGHQGTICQILKQQSHMKTFCRWMAVVTALVNVETASGRCLREPDLEYRHTLWPIKAAGRQNNGGWTHKDPFTDATVEKHAVLHDLLKLVIDTLLRLNTAGTDTCAWPARSSWHQLWRF